MKPSTQKRIAKAIKKKAKREARENEWRRQRTNSLAYQWRDLDMTNNDKDSVDE